MKGIILAGGSGSRLLDLFRGDLRSLASLKQLLAELDMRLDAFIDREGLLDALPRRCAKPLAERRSPARRSTASLIASGLRGGTTNPVSPLTTASALPPTSVTIMVRPPAMPSRMTLEKPSFP